MTATAKKYNPGFLTDEQLVASFCVRTTEFELLVEVLHECTGSSNPHQIVIGPRGSGKTSLLLRVAAEVRRDAALASRCFPIVFAEESYEVATAGEFWLECLSHCAAQAPRQQDDPDLHRTVGELRAIRDDRMLADRCLGALLDFADRSGKRLLLVVENVNMLFRDMADSDAGWRLRKILQTEPRIIVFASATSRFEEIDHPDHALYDLFRVRTLRPLDTQQCAVLWESVSGRRPAAETIRSLEILTGGSPRLISIVASFGAGLAFRDLLSDLFDLVDDHTEYFRGHIESLAAQERRVYLALATLWKPATTREIADQARLDTSTCSAQLARLAERGVVQVAGGSARRKQYYLTERLYNIYYLLRRRRGPDRMVEALVHFMELYYSPIELKNIGARMIGEMDGLDADMQLLQRAAFDRLIDLPAVAEYRAELLSMMPPGMADEPDERAARELFETTVALNVQNNADASLAACEELICRFEDSESPAVLEWVAKATVNKGVLLGRLNRPQDALAAYGQVVRRFGRREMPFFREPVARALVFQGTVLDGLNRPQEALAAYDEMVRRFGHSDAPALLELVAMALGNKADALRRRMSRPEEALAAWDEVVHRFGKSETQLLLASVAKALVNQGAALQELDRFPEALTACDEVVRRFDAGESPTFPEPVATALVNKGAVLVATNRYEEALAVWDAVVRRFAAAESPDLLAQVAMALVNKGSLLARLNRPQEALAVWNDVTHRFGESTHAALLASVARALVNKGQLLARLNRPGDALAACSEVERRFRAGESPVLLAQVAMAVVNRGALLAGMNRSQDALAAWGEVVRRFGENRDPVFLGPVAQALMNKGALLGELNQPQDALAATEQALRRFENGGAANYLTQVAQALYNKGVALRELNRPQEALAVWNEMVRRFGESEVPGLRGPVEEAILARADAELECGHYESAAESASLVIDRRATESLERRARGHLIRAKVSLLTDGPSVCEPDLKAALELLPRIEALPGASVETLMAFCVTLGPRRMHGLIQASPAASLLLPLTTALELELGLDPRVAREVEEVAQDIRRKLANLREHE